MAGKFVTAIAHMEGFNVPHSRPNRLNNPGDIEAGKFADAHGAIPSPDQRFAMFPDAETGFAALTALLQSPGYASLTVEQAINRYAPPIENNTTNYVDFICNRTGCRPTDTVTEALAL